MMPLTVSGEMNIWYWQYSAPANAVIAALSSGDLQLLPRHVHARRRRRVLVLGDRLQRVAQHAAIDAVADEQPHAPDAERDQVPRHLVGELQRVDRTAAVVALRRVAERAAGDVARRGDHLQHDGAQCQRHQCEIVADDAEAEAGPGDDQSRPIATTTMAIGNADPRREVEIVPQQRGDIGADAHEPAMAERHQAEPPHHRPGRVHGRPDQHDDQQMHRIRLVIDERQRHQAAPDASTARSAGHARRASRPCGLANIMAMKKPKANT